MASSEEYSTGWSLVGWIFIITTLFIGVRRLFKRKVIRVPHPNKSVAVGEPQVIIVGSGVLGSSLAAALGRDGRRVTVIERSLSESDRIVGELMQPGGVAALRKLGLEDCLEDPEKKPCRGIRIRYPDPTEFSVDFTYPGGQYVRNGYFVQQLRKAAMAEDKVTYIEGSVVQLLEEGGATVGVRYKPTGAEETKARRLLDCARGAPGGGLGWRSLQLPENTLIMPGVEFEDVVDLVLTEPGFLFLYQPCTSSARVLFDLPPHVKMPRDLKTYMKDVVSPVLEDDVAKPFLKSVKEGNYKIYTSNCVAANPDYKPGVIQLGDSLNMRHAVTAAGMTAALNDCLLTRDMLRKIPDLYNYSGVLKLYRQLIEDRKQTTFVINVMSYLLYNALASPDVHMRKYRRGLLQFASIDGFCNSGFVDLLAVLNTSGFFLMRHLALSILMAIGLIFKEEGLLRFPVALCHSCVMVAKVGRMATPYVWMELKSLF